MSDLRRRRRITRLLLHKLLQCVFIELLDEQLGSRLQLNTLAGHTGVHVARRRARRLRCNRLLPEQDLLLLADVRGRQLISRHFIIAS